MKTNAKASYDSNIKMNFRQTRKMLHGLFGFPSQLTSHGNIRQMGMIIARLIILVLKKFHEKYDYRPLIILNYHYIALLRSCKCQYVT